MSSDLTLGIEVISKLVSDATGQESEGYVAGLETAREVLRSLNAPEWEDYTSNSADNNDMVAIKYDGTQTCAEIVNEVLTGDEFYKDFEVVGLARLFEEDMSLFIPVKPLEKSDLFGVSIQYQVRPGAYVCIESDGSLSFISESALNSLYTKKV